MPSATSVDLLVVNIEGLYAGLDASRDEEIESDFCSASPFFRPLFPSSSLILAQTHYKYPQ